MNWPNVFFSMEGEMTVLTPVHHPSLQPHHGQDMKPAILTAPTVFLDSLLSNYNSYMKHREYFLLYLLSRKSFLLVEQHF